MFHILGVILTFTITFILSLPVLFLILMIGLRLYIEPIKGVCESKVKLHGKTALVTGGNSGIGLETARDLARRGAKVIIACRNANKSDEAIADIIETTGNRDVEFIYLDLANFSSVKKFAEEFNRTYDRLDIFVNNAGCALTNQPSEDGLDLVMQVNYFGPFLLTNLLLDKVISSTPSRIVIVSSYLHYFAKLTIDNLDGLSVQHYIRKYSNSKLCDLLWMKALAKRLPSGVTVNALHPGVVDTNIIKRAPYLIKTMMSWVVRTLFKTPVEGAQTTVHLCVSSEIDGVSGEYFMDCKLAAVSPLVNDDDFVEEVWKKSILLTH